MSARIARGRKSKGGRARSAAPARPTHRRRTTPRRAGWRVGGWIGAGMAVTAAFALLFLFRVPQLVGIEAGQAIGRAGFTVRHLEIRGRRRVRELDVYNIAFDQPSMAMPLVDLSTTRARLLRLGWVKEARVHRRLPDTLVIDIVERRPAAIWQHDGALNLIDSEGVVLEPLRIEATPDLVRLIGVGANRRLAAFEALLAGAPHLRPQVEHAAWVGGRRWDIRFNTGEVLALPEGDEAARRAILIFARMDQQRTMLGHGYARIDMRIPGRLIVDISREPGASVPALAPPDPGPRPADLSRTI